MRFLINKDWIFLSLFICTIVFFVTSISPITAYADKINVKEFKAVPADAINIEFTIGPQTKKVKHGKRKKTPYSHRRFYDVTILNHSDTAFTIKKLEIESKFGVQEIDSEPLSKAWGTIVIPAGGSLIEKDRWFSVKKKKDWPVEVTDTYYIENRKTGEKFSISCKVTVGE